MRLPTNLGETNSRSEERERESLGIVHIFTPIFILSLDYRTECISPRFLLRSHPLVLARRARYSNPNSTEKFDRAFFSSMKR